MFWIPWRCGWTLKHELKLLLLDSAVSLVVSGAHLHCLCCSILQLRWCSVGWPRHGDGAKLRETRQPNSSSSPLGIRSFMLSSTYFVLRSKTVIYQVSAGSADDIYHNIWLGIESTMPCFHRICQVSTSTYQFLNMMRVFNQAKLPPRVSALGNARWTDSPIHRHAETPMNRRAVPDFQNYIVRTLFPTCPTIWRPAIPYGELSRNMGQPYGPGPRILRTCYLSLVQSF